MDIPAPLPFAHRPTAVWSSEGVSRAPPDGGEARIRLFRRRFKATAGASLRCHAAADTRYRLWINGHPVGRGPAKGDIARSFYDSFDLSPWLVDGENVLAARVEFYPLWPDYGRGGSSVSLMAACPFFAVDALLDHGHGESARLDTDGQWRVAICEAVRLHGSRGVSPCVPMQEDFTAARYPHGFVHADFDDSGWVAATPTGEATRLDDDRDNPLPHRLLPRMVAPLEEEPWRPFAGLSGPEGGKADDIWLPLLGPGGRVSLPAGQRSGVWLDAGHLVTGFPRLRFSGRGRLTLVYAEDSPGPGPGKGRRDLPPSRRPFAPGSDDGETPCLQYDTVLAGGEGEYEPFHWRTYRWVYLEAEAGGGGLSVHGLEHSAVHYPYRELATFDCSDPKAALLWDICWRTARCCAHETFEDCPYHEQLQYGGDSQIQAMIAYTVAGDASLARQFLYHFDWSRQPSGLTRSRYPSRVPQTIPYWTLHWVMSLRDYWDYTADARTLVGLLPGALAAMDYFRRRMNLDGLVGRLESWRIADWNPRWTGPDGVGAPPGSGEGRSSYDSLMTAAAIQALLALLAAARGLGAAGDAEGLDDPEHLESLEAAWARRLVRLRAAAHQAFYDPAGQAYLDRPAGDACNGASAYTNAWAILAGMPADPAALAEKLVALDAETGELTFFSLYYAFRALAKADRYDLAPRLFGRWDQLAEWGCSTVPETCDLAQVRSECHAWGAGPLVEYTREVLGVRPLAPGYAVIGIEPHIAGLSHASGHVPLTRLDGGGPVEQVQVRWRVDAASRRFFIEAQAPKERPCRIRLPDGSGHEFPAGGDIRLSCSIS